MPTSRSYHHGDLRRVVLDAALEVIATGGPGAVSMRDLARRAGVSHAAPAHHFPNRAALLTALAAEGHELLAVELAGAATLREMGVRYVRFAREHPSYFEVMFRPDLVQDDDPALTAARGHTRTQLRRAVGKVSDDGEGGEAELAGLAAWSLAHGFATLHHSGALTGSVDGRDPDEVFRAATGLLFGDTGG